MNETGQDSTSVRRVHRRYLGRIAAGLVLAALAYGAMIVMPLDRFEKPIAADTNVLETENNNVVHFNYDGPHSAPASAEERSRFFRRVTHLVLQDLNMSPEFLAEIGRMKKLTSINFNFTTGTDEALGKLREQLQGLRSLVCLDFRGSDVTNVGLANIEGLIQLQELHLDGMQITDDEMRPLRGLKNLKILTLDDSQVGNAGVKSLTGLTKLELLDLSYTSVTDAGLASLKKMTSLKILGLVEAQGVTDDGLKHLDGLTSLNELRLSGCAPLTQEGRETLRKALPNCKIDPNP